MTPVISRARKWIPQRAKNNRQTFPTIQTRDLEENWKQFLSCPSWSQLWMESFLSLSTRFKTQVCRVARDLRGLSWWPVRGLCWAVATQLTTLSFIAVNALSQEQPFHKKRFNSAVIHKDSKVLQSQKKRSWSLHFSSTNVTAVRARVFYPPPDKKVWSTHCICELRSICSNTAA